jgi:hypothetical protein
MFKVKLVTFLINHDERAVRVLMRLDFSAMLKKGANWIFIMLNKYVLHCTKRYGFESR